MRNSIAIARRELGAYFYSPIAYIVIVILLLIHGYFFFTEIFTGSAQADMRPLFSMAPLWFAIFTPMVTMGLFAEERQTGTLEMLLALPVTDWEVVIGKFLAAVGLMAVTLLLMLPWAFFVASYGNLDWGPVIGGFLGLLLMIGGYLAVGLMTSVWTKNQIIACVVGIALCMTLFIMGKLLQVVPPSLAPIVQSLSFDYHFQSIARGVIDTRDLLYYLSLIGICLTVAQTSLGARRWR